MRPSSTPSIRYTSHSGRDRSSGRAAMRDTTCSSWRSVPGAGHGDEALVELAVERRILDPVRVVEPERHLDQPASGVRRQAVQVLGVGGLLLRCAPMRRRRVGGRSADRRRGRSSSTTPCTGTSRRVPIAAAPLHPPGVTVDDDANRAARPPSTCARMWSWSKSAGGRGDRRQQSSRPDGGAGVLGAILATRNLARDPRQGLSRIAPGSLAGDLGLIRAGSRSGGDLRAALRQVRRYVEEDVERLHEAIHAHPGPVMPHLAPARPIRPRQ